MRSIEHVLISATSLTKTFAGRKRLIGKPEDAVHAFDSINLDILPGETLGLVGESGCGKTTLGKTLINLLPPTNGDVFYNIPPDALHEARRLRADGSDGGRLAEIENRYSLIHQKSRSMRRLRKELQIVLQDPFSALNPRMLVRDILADRIAVMYLGKVVEIGKTEHLQDSPSRHPYTEALLGSVPEPDPFHREPPQLLPGELPSARHPPSGCRFRTRCPIAQAMCAETEPPLVEHEPGHFVACHFR